MKKRILCVFILSAIAVVSFVHWYRTSAVQKASDLALLQEQVQQKQAAAEAEQDRALALERELNAARHEAIRNQQQAAALSKALSTNNATATNAAEPPGNNLLKDPAMREMMQKQQFQALDRNIKQLVNAQLQKKLNLSAEQTEQLRDLLRRKQLPAVELLMALMSGQLDQEQATAMGLRAKAERTAADAEIRNLLGKESYDYFDRYERSDPERGRVRGFRSQFADAGQPLSLEQEQQLIAAMYDERQKFRFTIDYDDPSSFDYTHLDDYFSEENMNRFFTEREQLNEQTLARVQTILTPDQLPEFERLLREHLERGKTTVRMTQALFPIRKLNKLP